MKQAECNEINYNDADGVHTTELAAVDDADASVRHARGRKRDSEDEEHQNFGKYSQNTIARAQTNQQQHDAHNDQRPRHQCKGVILMQRNWSAVAGCGKRENEQLFENILPGKQK